MGLFDYVRPMEYLRLLDNVFLGVKSGEMLPIFSEDFLRLLDYPFALQQEVMLPISGRIPGLFANVTCS